MLNPRILVGLALISFPQEAFAHEALNAFNRLATKHYSPVHTPDGLELLCATNDSDTGLTISRAVVSPTASYSIPPLALSLSVCPGMPAAVEKLIGPQPGNWTRVETIAEVREESPLQGLSRPQAPEALSEPEFDSESSERRRVREEARWLFITWMPKPEINKIEALFTRYREGKERTQSGVWKLTVAYSFLATLKNDWTTTRADSVDLNQQVLDEWIAKFPNSPTPYLFHSEIAITQTLALLRDRLAREAIPGGVEALNAKLEDAKLYLEKNRSIASNDPHWFALMIRILRAQGKPIDDIVSVALEGAEKFPTYQDIYFEAVRSIGRLSRHPLDDIEALANTATKLTQGEQGDELYARVYWVALREALNNDQITQLRWDWKKMIGSMNTVLSRYPNQWNIQNFAQFACMMQDQEVTHDYIERVKGRPDMQVWGQIEYFEACRSWSVAKGESETGDKDSRKATFGAH
jgi:hypothetical protein